VKFALHSQSSRNYRMHCSSECSRFGNPGVPFQKDGAGTRVMRTPTLLIGSTIARARARARATPE